MAVPYGRYEAIAPPGKRRDVACAILPVAQRLSKIGDVEPQTVLTDGDIRPNLGHQVPLAHGLIWVGDECNQNIERSGAQLQTGSVFREQSFAYRQCEGAERCYVSGLCCRRWQYISLPQPPGACIQVRYQRCHTEKAVSSTSPPRSDRLLEEVMLLSPLDPRP